ncbi:MULTISPECIES: serine hydrolase [unclassified Actinomyces]|uniref:serine hydrolase domain-containing protein n=1 Tax=unclassified Actinomyces TaxID=2609248 RepID=UPI000D58D933|nr:MULTISPECIES: serine hydrolase domain-containing protein [unclassified Actinomyces]RAX23659.1 penicillin-binding protein [Actinomyces sp. Z3]
MPTSLGADRPGRAGSAVPAPVGPEALPAGFGAVPAPVGPEDLPAVQRFDFPIALIAGELLTDADANSPSAPGARPRFRTLARVGDGNAVFPLASLTKPIVAWSALIAADRHLLDLDAPAAPELPGATVRDLLAHASGVAFDSDAVLAPPRQRRIYSNRGFEILGRHLEEATATPLEAWVEEAVLEPLGMASVRIPGSPAHSGTGSAADLAAFARELAAPTLVSPALAEAARRPVHPGLPGVLPGYGRQAVNDFGLGLEVRGAKQPHWTAPTSSPETFGHFGQSGSFIWIDPVARRQAVFLGARPFGTVHRENWPALGAQILAL